MRNGHRKYALTALDRRVSPNRRAALARSTQAALERLEDRQLLTTSINVSSGVLTLTGDPVSGSSLMANLDSNGKVIHVSADEGHLANVSLSSVKQINIIGGSGGDYVYVSPSLTVPVTVNGGDGNDTIQGGGGNNTVTDGNGIDWISTHGVNNYVKVGNGKATVLGGSGDDTIIAGNGSDLIDGGIGGNDSVTCGNGNDTVNVGVGNDTVVAGNGNDCINGGLGDDRITVGTGLSTLMPGTGTNYLVVGNVKDVVVPAAGKTTIVDTQGNVISAPTGVAPVKPAPAWVAYSATSPVDSTAPQAVMEMLAPTPYVGIAISVRALGSVLGSGSAITANYQWDFGDPTGECNNLPGFNASHVYNVPGAYTVTLTITNELGKKSSVSTQLTINTDSRKVIYVDSVSGNDANSGTSPGAAIRSFAKAASKVRDNMEVLFNRGETFNTTTPFLIPYTNVVIGAYGSGAKPVINQTARLNSSVLFSTQSVSTGVTIRDLALDMQMEAADPGNRQGVPNGVVPRGADITVYNVTFLHVTYGVDAGSGPMGLTVQDCDSPNAMGIQGYFLWSQGSDIVVLNNKVVNSIHEHVIRTSTATQLLIAYNDFTNNDGKGCIEIHDGSYAWVESNKVTNGDIRVGPLGLWNEAVTSATDYAVVEGNTFNNTMMRVQPGSHHISIRNNIIHRDQSRMIDIKGQDGKGRQTADILILNNTGVSNGTGGEFLFVENHTNGITLQNNLLLAPHYTTGVSSTSGVYVSEKDLSSFTDIRGNVWPIPASILLWAQGGINYVGLGYVSSGYQTAAEWNAWSKVHGDFFSNIGVNATYTPAVNSIAAGADAPALGVFGDFYGHPRPAANWSAGAVQV